MIPSGPDHDLIPIAWINIPAVSEAIAVIVAAREERHQASYAGRHEVDSLVSWHRELLHLAGASKAVADRWGRYASETSAIASQAVADRWGRFELLLHVAEEDLTGHAGRKPCGVPQIVEAIVATIQRVADSINEGLIDFQPALVEFGKQLGKLPLFRKNPFMGLYLVAYLAPDIAKSVSCPPGMRFSMSMTGSSFDSVEQLGIVASLVAAIKRICGGTKTLFPAHLGVDVFVHFCPVVRAWTSWWKGHGSRHETATRAWEQSRESLRDFRAPRGAMRAHDL